MKQIGPRMQQVADYVRNHPGCPKLWPARAVAPYGRGLAYGYASVNRAIKAGLIKAEVLPNGRYRLTVSKTQL